MTLLKKITYLLYSALDISKRTFLNLLTISSIKVSSYNFHQNQSKGIIYGNQLF